MITTAAAGILIQTEELVTVIHNQKLSECIRPKQSGDETTETFRNS